MELTESENTETVLELYYIVTLGTDANRGLLILNCMLLPTFCILFLRPIQLCVFFTFTVIQLHMSGLYFDLVQFRKLRVIFNFTYA